MTSEYVAGSLSALFGKKSQKSEGAPVKLKHVKRLYEEFTPLKKPQEIGNRQGTPAKKRKSEAGESVIGDKQKGRENSLVKKRAKHGPQRPPRDDQGVEPNDNTLGEEDATSGELTNRTAALKRIRRKASLKQEHDKEAKEEAKRDFRYYEDDPAFIPQTIFVKNLPPKSQRKHVKRLFEKCGDILFVRFANAIPAKAGIPVEAAIKKRSLIKEGTTISAFVVFKDASSVQTAIDLNGIEYEGHHLRVDRREASNIPQKRSVFCGNIPFDTTDDALWDFFEEAGAIDYVRVVRDNETGIGKGIAFVVFKDASSAALALEFSSKEFQGRAIRVSAIEKRKTTLPSSKNALLSGSKEKISKRKLEKKAIRQEMRINGAPRMSKQKKEKIKKSIKQEKLKRGKKKFARKLQGENK
ncbi:RNA-binding protein 34 [Galendromus occidentalis]|uniref:RNA-binding protein 34 n=1 Tax=Galendromus occidentalis TaxID=34638 RepID=A0AAJ6VXZ0_9ACAR|nr:RNA-binding protein 34 [Galendromus occidentalis]